MAYVALYRKYRPATFKDVVGQDHVVSVLEASFKKGSISHAYLFAGSRGTGKTSVARIFAKSLGVEAEDLYEMDAASNRGIDEVRAIRESVHTLPYRSKYKVYIIDEAHMLTKEAFNALLKTLEEPPAHVIFILATTELAKVIETVISRCQVFIFKKPSKEVLKNVIISDATLEGFVLDVPAAELLALVADGSYRDALGLLEKVIGASRKKTITLSDVEKIVGAPQGMLLNALIDSIEKRDTGAGLAVVERFAKGNVDMGLCVKLLLERIRAILLLRFARELEADIREEYSEDDFTFLKGIASLKNSKINAAFLATMLECERLMLHASEPALPLEMALIAESSQEEPNTSLGGK